MYNNPMKIVKVLFLLILMPVFLMAEGISLSLDNDVFAHTDQDYTHGTKIVHMCDHIPLFLDDAFEGRKSHVNYVIGQYMYTPTDITIETLIEEDRPYAGWLYLGYAYTFYTPIKYDSFEIDLGVTGEWSGADETQVYIHKHIGSKEPMGWDNQLEEEVGINFIWQEKWKFKLSKYVDIIPHYGVSLGTIHTFANGGGIIRTGFNLPDDFGPIMMEPVNRDLSNWYSYFFAGVDGRLIARNFFLDGNLFEDSHNVEKEDIVADIRVGAALSYDSYEIVYMYTIRSKEHKSQEEHNEFGSLMLSWEY